MSTPIASVSGIRGVFNESLTQDDIVRYVRNFASLTGGRRFLVARDTRTTSAIVSKTVSGTLLAQGGDVVDYGVISTPALFRESRTKQTPAVMVTASHNEPDWNGLKFLLNGRGIVQRELETILKPQCARVGSVVTGRMLLPPPPSYDSELVKMAGEGSAEGVVVVNDANGGSAIFHAQRILVGLGCNVVTLGGTPGLFSRRIDPTADGLELLCRTVKEKKADVGFAFDCDGDRLVLVDSEGTKRSGDYMLTLALGELLQNVDNRTVVVSVDTTRAVDEVVGQLGGTVLRSRVGEANVISMMVEKGARFGGEGSSGGLIDGEFNYCRDSMLAAITIAKAVKRRGREAFERVRSYSQVRLKVPMDRRKAAIAIKRLNKEHPDAETLDGLKVNISKRSWVLVRPSGTEDVVRVSAESASARDADEIAKSYLDALMRLAG